VVCGDESILKSAVAAAIFYSGVSAHAAQFNVRVVNLTNGVYFTPLLVTDLIVLSATNVKIRQAAYWRPLAVQMLTSIQMLLRMCCSLS
jgi:hypothetical protein